MNFEVNYIPELSAEERFVEDTLSHISELYYSGEDMAHPTAEYFRGVLNALYHTGKLTEPEYDVYMFEINKLRERRRKS